MKRAAAPFLILMTLSCASTRPVTADSARGALFGFVSALNALDLDGMASYFADDITAFVPARQADRVDGKAALVEIFRRYVDATKQKVPRTNLIPENLVVTISGNEAVASFNIRPPGTGTVNRRTFVMRYDGERWQITHFHASEMALANVVK